MVALADRSAQASRFFHLWQRFQERNGVVAKSYSSQLSLLELNLLIEASLAPDRSGAQLSQLLNVPPLTISRALTRLEAAGLVVRRAAPHDARIRENALTAAGVRTLHSIDIEANERLRSMNPAITAAELKRLVKLMETLAGALPIKMAEGRASDHPLRPTIRTLTRGLGLLGSSVFEIDSISTFEWHVLTAIEQGMGKTRAHALCDRFQAQRNSLSVLLQRLERQNLLRRTVGESGDRREKLLAIQPKGVKVLTAIARNGIQIFASAMQPLAAEQATELCGLFEHFIGQHPDQRQLSINVIVKPISGKPQTVGIFLDATLLLEFRASDPAHLDDEEVVRQLKLLARPQPKNSR